MIVIGLSGRRESGKDSTADWLELNSPTLWPGKRVRKFALAGVLKEIAIAMFGVPHACAYGSNALKDTPLPHLPGSPTVRGVLQRLGHAYRDIWEDVWVAKMFAVVDAYRPDVCIITDVRCVNEIAWIRKRGGKVVRLLRAPHEGDTHTSETDLDGFSGFDGVVDNRAMSESERNGAVLRELIRLGCVEV